MVVGSWYLGIGSVGDGLVLEFWVEESWILRCLGVGSVGDGSVLEFWVEESLMWRYLGVGSVEGGSAVGLLLNKYPNIIS